MIEASTLDDLDRLSGVSDHAARHALAHLSGEQWLDVDLAETLLSAARALRSAGRTPSPAVVEAMQRCAAAHRAWAEASAAEASDRADHREVEVRADGAARTETDPEAETTVLEPIRIKVGLGELVKGMMQVRRS